ncbi:MAG TPA: aldo/keto reductase [Acidimicrobiales bacterium]|nr:aldo/keto reductase [Acidimicrobiales bacterium]
MDETTHEAHLSGSERMPVVGFGTWQIRGDACIRAVGEALSVGYRHLDTATVYENEDEVGWALEASGLDRSAVFVTTKVPPFAAGKARSVLEQSLARLRTDYVDLWLIHWPEDLAGGVALWEEMIALHREGRARAIGVSNFEAEAIDKIVAATGVVPAVDQIRWSPFLYDALEAARLAERGVVLEGYSPLKESFLFSSTLAEMAGHHGVTPAQVVLRWHVQHGFVVIPKSVTPSRIAENIDLFGFALDDEEMGRLDSLGGP